MKRFVYFYFNYGAPERMAQAVPLHVAYWRAAPIKDYQGGPFADRSGGLISFTASDLQQARKIILQDPFALQGLIAEKWIKEWVSE